jgi:hypothetical protein
MILIVGDSFSADYTAKYPTMQGWPNLLAKDHSVTNLSQAGCSEYKIQQQLASVDQSKFTHCVVVHTSPFRIPVEVNPLHHNDVLHHSCDFIYSDVASSDNRIVECIKEYFEKYLHNDFFLYTHRLIMQDIHNTITIPALHLTFFNYNVDHNQFVDKNYYKLFSKKPGPVNHLNEQANQQVYADINNWIADAV